MLTEFLKGFGVTLKHLFGKSVTELYPEQKRPMPPRTRWCHILQRHENGLERCIGCSLCAAACPSHCIHVVAGENTDAERLSPGERNAKVYEINMLRCIFCGYCQDACPTEAIVLRENFELADYKRTNFIYDKQRLLAPTSKGKQER